MKKVYVMLVALTATAAAAIGVSPAVAQQKRASPHETIYTKVGKSLVQVTYGRPYSKDREIWGKLVPYGKAWRAGADEATTMITQADINVGGANVPAGAYTLYMVPNADGTAKLAISKAIGAWGIPVNEKADLARVDMKKGKAANKVDQFTMTFEKGPVLKFAWAEAEYTVELSPKK
ncbi:MAG TPA: DUF2911 domain-containing protein [Gemmataceae bacterium]|nr:DUF2911 domain-containing protein [Gemmataceae bacterium]